VNWNPADPGLMPTIISQWWCQARTAVCRVQSRSKISNGRMHNVNGNERPQHTRRFNESNDSIRHVTRLNLPTKDNWMPHINQASIILHQRQCRIRDFVGPGALRKMRPLAKLWNSKKSTFILKFYNNITKTGTELQRLSKKCKNLQYLLFTNRTANVAK